MAGDYFDAMGVPLIEGRFLRAADLGRSQQLCVVDDTFARHYWPHGGAVGKQVYRGTGGEAGGNKPLTVVGVVGTVKQGGLTSSRARGAIYFSYDLSYFRNYFLVARTSLAPEALATALAKAVREADPDVPPDRPCAPWRCASATASRRGGLPRCWPRSSARRPSFSRRSDSTASWRSRCRSAHASSASAWRWAPRPATCSASSSARAWHSPRPGSARASSGRSW